MWGGRNKPSERERPNSDPESRTTDSAMTPSLDDSVVIMGISEFNNVGLSSNWSVTNHKLVNAVNFNIRSYYLTDGSSAAEDG